VACVRKRRGKWVIDYYDDTGKRRWETIGTNKKAAEEILAERMVELRKGTYTFGLSKTTIKEYSDKWHEIYAKLNSLKTSTAKSYKQCLDNHIVPALGHLPLRSVRRDQIKQFIAMLSNKGLSRNSVRIVLATLRAMLNTAVEDNVLGANPAVKLGKFTKTVGEHRADINPFNRDELAIFLTTMRERFPIYYPFFLTLARTGMRLGETLALQWDDIDFNGRTIEVKRNLVEGRVGTPKNGKSRKVDMSLQLTEVLKDLHDARKEEAFKRQWQQIPDWVFCDCNGNPLDGNNLRKRVFRKCLVEAKLRKIRIHDLRHSFATQLLQNGESPAYVRDQLGHHSIQVTVDIYGHLLPGGNKRAVDKLDDRNWERNPIRTVTPHHRRGSKMVARASRALRQALQVREKVGATRRSRTGDLLITNQLLCRLS
jgi:integrase